jgi:hypothetical protein
MRDFSKVSPTVWQSERFNSLPSDDGRYVYLYLLTNEHQTSAGCYRLPDGYACSDLRWASERYAKARGQLIDAGLIRFDSNTQVVMITRWFKHNPPMNEDHQTGIVRILERLPSEVIASEAMQALEDSLEAIRAEKAAKVGQRQKPAHAFSNGLSGQITERLQTNILRGQR